MAVAFLSLLVYVLLLSPAVLAMHWLLPLLTPAGRLQRLLVELFCLFGGILLSYGEWSWTLVCAAASWWVLGRGRGA